MSKKVIILSFSLLSTLASAGILGPFPNGVPGSGYGCDKTCGGGDVHYTLRASLETYSVPGTGHAALSANHQTLSMFTRTFTGVANESSPFCHGYDGSAGPIGPCLQVNPGQRMTIKVINDMKDGMEKLKQHKAELEQFYALGQAPFPWLGRLPPTPANFTVDNYEDLPGWDVTFDDVNIHLHGMQVVPHLYFPMGTGSPDSEMITIQPPNENASHQCFCYVFDVPLEHPQGYYFWHTHRHGAAAMQGWQAMFGYMLVGTETNPGSVDAELAAQGVLRTEPLAIWEWTVGSNDTLPNEPNTYFEGQLFGTQVTTYLTNNEFMPTFTACVGETIHFALLCAQAAAGSAIFVLDENNEVVPFYVFASDGIAYSQPYLKTMIIVGQAQREGLLMQFPRAGKYRIMQNIIPALPGAAALSAPRAPAAFVMVSDQGCTGDGTNITSLTFTPGMDNIPLSNVSSTFTVVFQAELERNQVPLPQLKINNELYASNKVSTTVEADTAQQWVLFSGYDIYHPFHIHVNPFQVQSVSAGQGFIPGNLPGGSIFDAVTTVEPANLWRDTVFIPPMGVVTINLRFGHGTAWAGKTVFHCHNLIHEDLGMIANMVIANPVSSQSEALTNCSARGSGCWSHSDCCPNAADEPMAKCKNRVCV